MYNVKLQTQVSSPLNSSQIKSSYTLNKLSLLYVLALWAEITRRLKIKLAVHARSPELKSAVMVTWVSSKKYGASDLLFIYKI